MNQRNFRPGPWCAPSLKKHHAVKAVAVILSKQKYSVLRWHHSVPNRWTMVLFCFFGIWTWKNTQGCSSLMSWERKKITSKQTSFSSFPSHTALNLVCCLWSATNCFLPVVISYCAAHMNSFKGPVGDCSNWQTVTDTADFLSVCLFWSKITLQIMYMKMYSLLQL